MSKGKSIEFEGITYQNLKVMCSILNLSYSLVKSRLDRNWDLHKAVYYDKSKDTIPIRGRNFSNVKEACIFFNISYPKVQAKASRDSISLVEALEYYLDNNDSIVFLGKKYSSFKKLCEEYNVSYSRFKLRYKKYKNIDIAIGYGLALGDGSKGDYLIGDGVLVLKNLGNNNYFCLDGDKTVVLSINELQDRRVKAFNSGIIEYSVVLNGITFTSYNSMCEYYNVNPATVKSRLLSGDSLREALNIKLKQKGSSKKVEFLGVRYESISLLCITLNINYTNVKSRIRNGYSLEEAVGYVLKPDTLGVYNKIISKNIKVDYRLSENYFRCRDELGNILYYMLDELQEIRKEAFLKGERF